MLAMWAGMKSARWDAVSMAVRWGPGVSGDSRGDGDRARGRKTHVP